MTEHPALQDTSGSGPVSAEAASLASSIISGETGLDAALQRAAAHLLSEPRVESVAGVLTSFVPEDTAGWNPLGRRAWVREWTRPGRSQSFLPPLAPARKRP